MKLYLTQLQDYIQCPLYFHFKHLNGLDDDKLSFRLSSSLHELFYCFFFQVMDNKIMSVDEILEKWNQIWFKGIDPVEFIFNPRTEEMDTGYKAVPLIQTFYDEYAYIPGAPLVINQEATIQIEGHEIVGTIELVREMQEGAQRLVELVDFKTGTQVPTKWNVENDLAVTFQSIAFRELFGAKEHRILYHFLRSNRMFHTTRGRDSYDRFNAIVRNVCRSIERGLFYPRQTFMCTQCNFAAYCSAWGTK